MKFGPVVQEMISFKEKVYGRGTHDQDLSQYVTLSLGSGELKQKTSHTRGDQKVRGKVLLYHITFIYCNENSQIETTIRSKLTEIEI